VNDPEFMNQTTAALFFEHGVNRALPPLRSKAMDQGEFAHDRMNRAKLRKRRRMGFIIRSGEGKKLVANNSSFVVTKMKGRMVGGSTFIELAPCIDEVIRGDSDVDLLALFNRFATREVFKPGTGFRRKVVQQEVIRAIQKGAGVRGRTVTAKPGAAFPMTKGGFGVLPDSCGVGHDTFSMNVRGGENLACPMPQLCRLAHRRYLRSLLKPIDHPFHITRPHVTRRPYSCLNGRER
jgi:hypothetical protein